MFMLFFFFLMIRRPPKSTRYRTLFPYTTSSDLYRYDRHNSNIRRYICIVKSLPSWRQVAKRKHIKLRNTLLPRSWSLFLLHKAKHCLSLHETKQCLHFFHQAKHCLRNCISLRTTYHYIRLSIAFPCMRLSTISTSRMRLSIDLVIS